MLTLLALALAAPTPPVPWIAGAATYRVEVDGDDVRVSMTYRFDPVGGGFQDVRLVGPGLAIDVAPEASTMMPDGLHLQLGPGLPREVVVEGRVISPGHALAVQVLPATRQEVVVDAPGLDLDVDGAVGGWLSPTDTLSMRWAPAAPVAKDETARVHAEVATGVWAADQGLSVHAVVRWDVVRGSVSELRVGVAGLEEVEPTGAGLASWRRDGDTLVLLTKTPVAGRFVVNLRARSGLPAGGAMPAPKPTAARVESWWVLGKADEGEVVPEGGESIAQRALPPWARGLTETTQLAAWRGNSAPTLRYARYEMVDSVGTVVAKARHQVVSNEDGRIFVRSTLRVRNERRQYLNVLPEAGFVPLGARVSGQPVTVLSDGNGGLYVPLEKSVETVRGLVSFPVELLWVAETTPFERRGTWSFRLPALDAPVQRVEWEVHLPREVQAPRHDGNYVAPEQVAGQELALRALQEYRKNNFEVAQALLDDARSVGGEDEDIAALQSNLDVLGKKDASDDGTARRVRELANSRNMVLAEEQTKAEADAEKAILSGDYAKADELNRFVEESAKKLAMTEQRESGEQKEKLEKAKQRSQKLEEKVTEAIAYGSAVAADPKPASGAPAPSTPEISGYVSESTTTITAYGYGSGRGAGVESKAGEKQGVAGGVVGGMLGGATVTTTTGTVESVVVDGSTVMDGDKARSDEPVERERDSLGWDAPAPPIVVAEAQPSPDEWADLGDTEEEEQRSEDIEVSVQKPPAAKKSKVSGAKRPAPEEPAKVADLKRAGQSVPATTQRQAASRKPAEAPPRDVDNRVRLEAHASPFTLALPLDGTRVTDTQDLLAPGESPTFTVPYRGPR